MKNWNALLFVVFLGACNSTTTENSEIVKQDTVVTPKVETPLILEAEYVVEKEMITAIIVKKQGSGELFQKIEGLSLEYIADHPAYERPDFQDLNFDGNLDMLVTASLGNANIYYDYWLFNPTTKQLEANKDMELCLPEIDKENQQIISHERSSAAENRQTYYQYKDGKFVKTKIEDRTYKNETTYRSVVQELQADGTMKKVKDEVVKE